MKHILVTGAGGLVGRPAAQALHEAGHRVTGLYRTLPTAQEAVPWNVVRGDLLERGTAARLERMPLDAIVHCAAVLPREVEGEAAHAAAAANKCIDDGILQLWQRTACELIYTSTTSVYGLEGSPWSEESPVRPVGPYAAGKLETETRMAEVDLPSVVLRISAPYGPRQRTRTVLRVFMERAVANLDLLYWGDGRRQQDFTSAEDVAQVVVAALSRDAVHGVFNVAGGRPIAMRTLAELVVATVEGTTSKVRPVERPDPQESYRAAVDLSKSREQLGWRPATSLEEGIRRWAAYLRRRP